MASTVVAPIEEQINGVENMLYVSSNSTADGRFSIAVTFDIGTNLDIAQVQVQNRVAIAQPRLPADVRNIGVTVTKSSPDLMMVVHLYSPDKSRDPLFISNYATLEIKDALTRVDGVGSITVFGSRDYSMRIWLDPDRLQSLGLTANDVVTALQGQNVQVASGVLNQPPVDEPGRLPDRGADARPAGRSGRVRQHRRQADAPTRWCASRTSRASSWRRRTIRSNSYLNRDPAVALAMFQRPGSNALATAQAIRATMAELSKRFPPGVKYDIVYDPTQFIQQSVDAVQETIFEAIVLVVLVVILFLQTWRAAIIPLVAIPVSLIGTFFFMAMFGFTLNNLSLFGLVLAIGIVVDDAIVVVENVERNIAAGLEPARRRDQEHGRGRRRADRDRAGAVRGVRAVGLHHRHFRAVLPAVRAHHRRRDRHLADRLADAVAGAVRAAAQAASTSATRTAGGSGRSTASSGCSTAASSGLRTAMAGWPARVVRIAVLMLVVYAGVLAFGLNEFRKTPIGFIPQVDRGYLIVVVQLPPGASLARTDEVNRRAVDIALADAGRRRRGQHRRLLRRDLHQCAELGRDLPGARRRSSERAKDPNQSAAAIQRALFRQVMPRSRRRWSWSWRRRRCAASAMPAASA